MCGALNNLAGKTVTWSVSAIAVLALIAVGASPLIAASPDLPPAPGPVPTQSKTVPQPQTSEEFQRTLGVPLEGAGGGAEAVLEQNAHAAVASLEAAGYETNQFRFNHDPLSADVLVVGTVPTQAAQAAAQAAADGAAISFVRVSRTTAQAMAQQARIDADRAALAKRGITIRARQ